MNADEHLASYRQSFGDRIRVPAGAIPARLIAVVFTNRCGSMLLTELVGSSPDVTARYEIFNGDTICEKARMHGLDSFERYLRFIFPGTGRTFIAKVHVRQLGFLAALGLLDAFAGGVDIIHSRRRDTVAQAVSHSIAHQTGRWTSLASGAGQTEPVYRLDEIRAIRECIERENSLFAEQARRLGFTAETIEFEDLLSDPKATLDPLWRHLGIRPGTLRPDHAEHQSQWTARNRCFAERFREEARVPS